nr:Crp/Fnr family transcriptional regulator [Chryseosolibacter indicus]
MLKKIRRQTFEKGEYLLKNGQVCSRFYFVEHGLLKTSFKKEDKEFIMKFFTEGSICTQLESYITQGASTYDIIALEASTVAYLTYSDFESLCQLHHSIERLYRKFVSMAAINMMKRISEMLEENATVRYNNFIREQNDLLQRVSLGDLANYLGITQVSLSRIRARK